MSYEKNAVMAELLSRMSYFQKELDRRETVKDSVYYNVLLTMYCLAKEEVANKKLVSLLKLLEQVGLEDMKLFQHRSQGLIREMFLLLGHTVKAQMIRKVSEGSSYGLLTDEVCDISNKEQLVTFIKYVDRETSKANTSFLDVSNLLESSTSANAETITHTITQQIDDAGLKRQHLSSFASDGVSVMTRKTNGVAARLRRTVNPSLINIHCICHRLALACASANDSLSFLLKVEKILLQLWKYFDNSAKRAAAYAKAVTNLKKVQVRTKREKKTLRKRFKKACRTRWLSTEQSIDSVFEDYEALLQTLRIFKEDGDATATGLLSEIGNIKFLGAVYLLHKTLPQLSDLSKAFQKGAVSFAAVSPAVDYTLDELDVAKNFSFISDLKNDLKKDGRLSRCDLGVFSQFHENQLKNLTTKYIKALKENIQDQFDGNLPVITAFEIFNPIRVPERQEAGFKEYGIAEIKVMADYFYQNLEDKLKEDKTEELLCEWRKFKYNLLNLQKEVPPELSRPVGTGKDGTKKLISKTPTEWLLEHMLSLQSTYIHLCPNLLQLAEVCFTLPVSNAWPERGASAIKRLKTRLRSNLKNDMLTSLLQITVNGPDTSDCHHVIEEAMKEWLSKPRRKIAKYTDKQKEVTKFRTVDASVQVES